MDNHQSKHSALVVRVVAICSLLTACGQSGNDVFNRESAEESLTGIDDFSSVQSNLVTAGYTVTVGNANVSEDGGTTTFSVRLVRQPASTVTLRFASDNTAEGTLSASSLSFTTANWSTPQTVTVTGATDTTVDGTRSFHVMFTNSTSNDHSFQYTRANPIVPAPIKFNTLDTERGFAVRQQDMPDERGSRGTLQVRLSRAPLATVTVNVSSTNTGEGTVSPAQLTYTTTNWGESQAVRVTGVDDGVVDNDPGYHVRLTATSGDTNYNGKTINVPMSTFGQGQDIVANSQSSAPFTCGSDRGRVFWNPTTPAGEPSQLRTFSVSSTDANYVQIRLLQVTLASTYMRVLTEIERDEQMNAGQHAVQRIVEATRGLMQPTITRINLNRFWDRSAFSLQPNQATFVEFTAFQELRDEIAAHAPLDVDNYDFVLLTIPADGVGVSLLVDRIARTGTGGYYVPVVNPVGSRNWLEGKVGVRLARPNDPTHWGVFMHELAHLMEEALQRGGAPQMLNPDHPFWDSTFGADGGYHWPSQDLSTLRGYYWTQKHAWPSMTTATDMPKGVLLTRTATRSITSSCPTSSSYLERVENL